MKQKALEKAAELALQTGFVLIATADGNGWPHLTAARHLSITAEKHLAVSAWFCPRTTANLHSNPRLALVVWDEKQDNGYQLVGELEEIRDVATLDGFAPIGRKAHIPQVERQLLVHVDRILEFKQTPHTDADIGD